MKIREIASWFEGEVVGDDAVEIKHVAKIEEAENGSLTFLANPKYEKHLATTRASAVLVSRTVDLSKLRDRVSLTFIKVDDPYLAFVRTLKALTPELDPFPAGIDPTASVGAKAQIGRDVVLGRNVVVGDGASIGDRTKLAHGCVIGTNAQIGSDCLLYPNVVVYHKCRVGDRVIIHSGVVIGADGFGFAPKKDGSYEKIPQLGIVVLDDDVEVGANTTIDRATVGETRVKRGVKIDNLVQIAHNVMIGENTVIAAQTGISGSVKIGNNCIIAGQVGIGGHVEIAERTTILGQSGITKSLLIPGKTYFGTPAKEAREAFKIEAALRSLPQMSLEFAGLQRMLEEMRRARTRANVSAKKSSSRTKRKK